MSKIKTVDFLLELGCEEIPARFLKGLSESIKQGLLDAFDDYHIGYVSAQDKSDPISVFYTYRRLAFRIPCLHAMQADQTVHYQGPPVSASKDNSGDWTSAALGFAKKCGVSPDQLQTITDKKGRDCLYYESIKVGQETMVCLPAIIKDVIQGIHLPIAMRWGCEKQPFIRTLQWLCCLCNEDVVPVQLWDVQAGNRTRGHRFLTSDDEAHDDSKNKGIDGVWVTVQSPVDYEQVLSDHFVCVDSQKRRQVICDAIKDHCPDSDLKLTLLIDEVNGLVECPTPVILTFDEEYLKLPGVVLEQVMMKHQKYFPIWKEGVLTNNCIVIADNVTASNKNTIIEGNRRVIHSRFSDALYFWKIDCKSPLEKYVFQLDNMIFQKGLGTLLDKTTRLQQLVKKINQENGLKLEENELDRSAYLCKADLVTQMVYEFPVLQGVIGSFYAKKTESDVVVSAIRDHYLPLQSQGKLPDSPMGAVLALADRIDTIVACYVNDQIPTSSKDPLGVRRAMLGMLAILDRFQWSINLEELIKFSYSCFSKGKSNKDQLRSFFLLRVKHYMMESGIIHDVAEAVLCHGMIDFLGSLSRAKALMAYEEKDSLGYKRLIDSGVRCIRLLKEQQSREFVSVEVNPDLFKHDSEEVLFQAVTGVSESPALTDLETLVPVIETYFDAVMVMDDDEKVRHNRLMMVSCVANRFKSFAQFEKIVTG